MSETLMRCSCCGKEKKLTEYYSSDSPIHKFYKKIPVCKKCMIDMVDPNDVRTVTGMLRMCDKPFIAKLWETSIDESSKRNSNLFRTYMKNVVMQQYKDMDWDDSEFDNGITEYVGQEKPKSKTFSITDELIDKYGFGYTDEEYQAFERKYKKLIKNYSEQTAMHSEGLISYIRFRVKEEMATASGNSKEAKEWGAMAQKAAQDAKLNVSQLSKSDISGGVDLMTQLSEAVESELSVIPLLPKVLEQPYDDVDLVLWSNVNYNRRLEDKQVVPYREVWSFYDEMINEYCSQKGMSDKEKEEFINKRKGVFRDLADVYKEPLYEEDDDI